MISKVEPTENYFSINWKIGTRCNYDCMYCPTVWHDSDSQLHSLDSLKLAWTNLFNKTSYHNLPYKILFTGGEVTVNRNFLPFVQWLQEHYSNNLFKIIVTTNGSASLDYYLRMFNSVDNITFSLHSEHINEQEFVDKMIALKAQLPNDRFMHVNIMNEFWNQDRITLYKARFDQHNISNSVNEVNYSMQTRSAPIFHGKFNLEV